MLCPALSCTPHFLLNSNLCQCTLVVTLLWQLYSPAIIAIQALMKHFNLTLKLSKVRAYSLCAEKAWEGYELYIQEDKQVTSQIICMRVCLYVSFFYPQALGLLGLVATILSSSPTATQSLSLGVTTHRHPSCYCVFVPALHQLCSLMGPFFPPVFKSYHFKRLHLFETN